MQITKEEIKRVVSNVQNYTLAKKYLKAADIESMVVLCDASGQYHVDAHINQDVYSNHITINIDENYHVTAYECSCPFCTQESGCAHVGEVLMIISIMEPCMFPYHFQRQKFLLRYQEYQQTRNNEEEQKQQNSLLQRYEERKARRLREYEEYRRQLELEQRKRLMEKAHEWLDEQWHKDQQFPILQGHQDIHLYVQLENIDSEYGSHLRDCYISLKIGKGRKRMYIVKRIQEFLEAIAHEEYISYGKELAFTHTMEQFDVISQELIQLLKENMSDHLYYYSGREMRIQEEKLDAFYDKMLDIPREYRDFNLVEEKGKMCIEILPKDEDYQIVLLSPKRNMILGKEHVYKIKEKTLIRKTMNHYSVSLLKQLLEEDFWIGKNDIRRFQGHIIKQCKGYLTVKNKECLPVYMEEDYIQLFADMDEQGLISIRIKAHMPDGTIVNGFDDTVKEQLLHVQLVCECVQAYAQTIDYDGHVAYLSQQQDTTLVFLQEGLPYLSRYCDIFVSDALKSINEPMAMHVSVGIGMSNDLLQIDIASVDVTADELYDILRAYRKRRKYYRLMDGRLLSLEGKELEETNALLDDLAIDLKDIKKGSVQMPAYRSFHMEDVLQQDHDVDITAKQSYVDYLSQYHKKDIKLADIASRYEHVLRDYQKEGVKWMQTLHHYHFGGILADDMGLGKTLQVIALLETMKQEGQVSLIVTPSSLVLNWEDELQKFQADLRVQCIMGNAKERCMQIASFSQYDVLITSYDYLKRDITQYETIHFYYLVLDEAQFIKNQKTKNAECVKQLKAVHRLALSGTPIENTLAELWSIFDFLMPGYLFNYHYFQTHFEKNIVQNHDEQTQMKLKKMVEPFILRRTKSKVLKELPDKIEHTLMIPFEDTEKKLYLANLSQVNQALSKHLQMERPDKFAILAMLTRLRQICCEPRILYENITTASSKLLYCLDLLETLRENHQRVLLFSSFTSVLDILEEELIKRRFSYLKLTGNNTKQQRRDMVQQFQNGLTDVFLISLKAGGTGLNLTAASAVIHFDPWWNVSAQNQATDRAYRIGQNQNVQVYKLIMKDSIEEKIQTLQKMKKDLSDHFVEENEGSIYHMSYDEIVSLFDME